MREDRVGHDSDLGIIVALEHKRARFVPECMNQNRADTLLFVHARYLEQYTNICQLWFWRNVTLRSGFAPVDIGESSRG